MTIRIQHLEPRAIGPRPFEHTPRDKAVAVQVQVRHDRCVGGVEQEQDGGPFDGGCEGGDDVGAAAGGAPDVGADDAGEGFGAGGKRAKGAAGEEPGGGG